MYLARHQTPTVARTALSSGIPGIYGKREYRRFYPAGEVVSQLVGTTNIDGAGASGVEMKFDDSLQGVPARNGLSKICTGRRLDIMLLRQFTR